MTQITETQSVAAEAFTLAGCLQKANELLGAVVNWNPQNADQKWLVSQFKALEAQMASLPELHSYARWTAEEINAILEEYGFDIRLEPWIPSPDSFGVASLVKYEGEWQEEGSETFHKGSPHWMMFQYGVRLFKDPSSDHPVIVLRTKRQDERFVFQVNPQISGFDLLEKAQSLRAYCTEEHMLRDYDAVVLPFVDMDVEVDMSWLKGMAGTFGTRGIRIVQALQQVKLQMTNLGYVAEAAAAMEMFEETCFSGPENPYFLDQPFIAALVRDGVDTPLVTAWLPESTWKNPAGE